MVVAGHGLPRRQGSLFLWRESVIEGITDLQYVAALGNVQLLHEPTGEPLGIGAEALMQRLSGRDLAREYGQLIARTAVVRRRALITPRTLVTAEAIRTRALAA